LIVPEAKVVFTQTENHGNIAVNREHESILEALNVDHELIREPVPDDNLQSRETYGFPYDPIPYAETR
jgi:hypothetical protein